MMQAESCLRERSPGQQWQTDAHRRGRSEPCTLVILFFFLTVFSSFAVATEPEQKVRVSVWLMWCCFVRASGVCSKCVCHIFFSLLHLAPSKRKSTPASVRSIHACFVFT